MYVTGLISRNDYNLQLPNFSCKRSGQFFETEIHAHVMSGFEKHKVSSPDFYGQRKMEFVVGDSVRVRVGNTHDFRNDIILIIDTRP